MLSYDNSDNDTNKIMNYRTFTSILLRPQRQLKFYKAYSQNIPEQDQDCKKADSKKEKINTENEHGEKNPKDPYAPFPDAINPKTGEIGGPKGPEPTRYGDWERKGRVIDF